MNSNRKVEGLNPDLRLPRKQAQLPATGNNQNEVKRVKIIIPNADDDSQSSNNQEDESKVEVPTSAMKLKAVFDKIKQKRKESIQA